jgi:hypothetical protein
MTLLGVGAMNSPRFAPAGMLLRYGRHRIAFDGGPGAEPPDRLDAWLVTDESAELHTSIRQMATDREVEAQVGDLRLGALRIQACDVIHTSHPTYGYRIQLDDLLAVWAPEFREFPVWAAHADLLFADASSWNRPIHFRGGVGGHTSVRRVEADATKYGVRRVVYAHIGRPCVRAIDAGWRPDVGEWGREGATYTLAS